MEAIFSSETSVDFQRYIPENRYLQANTNLSSLSPFSSLFRSGRRGRAGNTLVSYLEGPEFNPQPGVRLSSKDFLWFLFLARQTLR
jgi:hypothetical protein